MSDNVFARFEAHLIEADCAPKTIKAYLADLRQLENWLAEAGGALLDVTPQDLRVYRATFDAARPATFNRKLVAIKRFTAWAHDERLIDRDPAKAIKSIRQVRPAPRHLTDVDIRVLYRVLERYGNDRDRAIITLMLNTGLRVAEVCNLKPGDLELHERSGKLTVRGKGNKTREVPLNLEAREALTAYLSHKPPGDYVFMSLKKAGARLMPRGLAYMLARYSKLGNLDAINPHALRHRFAYQLRKTQSIEVVARLLGHESITTTAIYTEPTSADLQEAVDGLRTA